MYQRIVTIGKNYLARFEHIGVMILDDFYERIVLETGGYVVPLGEARASVLLIYKQHRPVVALQDRTLVNDISDIDGIGEQLMKMPTAKG